MFFEPRNKKEQLEKVIGIIESSMIEEGYITKRYSQTKKHCTTCYDSIILRDEEGKEYTISVDERKNYNRELGRWEESNDLAEEAARAMKFYEFSASDCGYYALIGAMSEEEAIEYYTETVGDIEDEDDSPDEITKEEARKKLLNVCKDSDEEDGARKEFNKLTLGTEPYLILIDGSLL